MTWPAAALLLGLGMLGCSPSGQEKSPPADAGSEPASTAEATATPANTFKLRGFEFTVPEGFVVEVAAEPPMLTYPTFADFDEQGRLYVAEVSGVENWQEAQPEGDEDKQHRVLRLVDTDGDGRFDERTVFARFDRPPQGSQWHDGSLYVASPPIIWKLTDTDDDGVADVREKWVEQHELTGCLNDLHGPNLGPDGYLYWTKGAGAVQTYELNGKPWSTTARHILRRHPQAVDTEQVMVGGMDNPVEITFSPDGERFVTCTNMHLNGDPRKDGIIHAVYGAVYPKDIAPVYEFPWTAPTLMPEMAGWEAFSPAGIARYDGERLGPDYDGNLFTALFSGHKILRNVLTPEGGTYRSRDEDFLVCDDIQFHPTDVLQDADGSLLVLDTGGWYKHCCPSSTFYRPDVRGAIYRVRRADAPSIDPRGLQIRWDKQTIDNLVAMLSDPRPVVRDRAVEAIGKRGPAAAESLKKCVTRSKDARAQRLAVWAATRIDDESARQVVREALKAEDETVRHAALSSISLRRDAGALEPVRQILAGHRQSPAQRRVAAEALGRIGDASVVPDLLVALATPHDRFLEHSLIYALIEIDDPTATAAGLKDRYPDTVRATMIALDQMPSGSVNMTLVAEALKSSDAPTRDVAWWIVSRHPDQAAGLLTSMLQEDLAGGSLDENDRKALVTRLGRIARTPDIATWLAEQLSSEDTAPEVRKLVLAVMAEAGGQYAELSWLVAIDGLLEQSQDPELIAACVTALDRFPPLKAINEPHAPPLGDRLRALAARSSLPDEVRVRAMTAIPEKNLGPLDDALFDYLVTLLNVDVPLETRTRAADVLSRGELTQPQLLRLAKLSGTLANTELERLLGLFGKSTDDEVGLALIASLETSSGLGSLHPSRIKTSLAGFGPPVQEQAKPLFDKLDAAYREQMVRADKILGMVASGDPQHGLQVFSSKKAACTSCHQAAYVGGRIGPHLRGVGTRRAARDLIESIIFPSASFVQSYEPWSITTIDGRTFTGVVQKDMPDELILSGGPDKTFHVRRDEIDEMVRANISIMPAGLEKNLSDQELADLVAYLQTLK